MTEQAMVDQIVASAKPRLVDLLKLKIRHIYEMTPGVANSRLVVEGCEVKFKLLRTSQVYKEVERFMAEDKLMGFMVTPGVLPIVKAISMDVRGRKMLITRRIASSEGDQSASAQIDDFGVRVKMSFDAVLTETQVIWECLYAVA
jgi:hypothetical protein